VDFVEFVDVVDFVGFADFVDVVDFVGFGAVLGGGTAVTPEAVLPLFMLTLALSPEIRSSAAASTMAERGMLVRTIRIRKGATTQQFNEVNLLMW
jgi:hypothetical protein